MPLPTSINDLDPIPANNFPLGVDPPEVIDNVLREHAAYIAQLRDESEALAVQEFLNSQVTVYPTGGDDTATIQAALDSGARRVLGVPNASYSVSSLLFPSNTEFDGQGCVINARTAGQFVISNSGYALAGNSNITLKNVTINGNKATLSGVKGMAFARLSTLCLENVQVYNCGLNGIYIGTTMADIHFLRCKVWSCGDHSLDTFEGCNINVLGATADFPNAGRVVGMTLIDCESYDSWCHGFIAQFADYLTMTGGRYHTNGRGRLVDPLTYYSNGVSGGQVYGFQLHGVSSYSNYESGYDIAAKSIGVEVVGCTARNNVLDGFFFGHITSHDYTITGNISRSNGRHGIYLSDTLYDATVSSNVCTNNVQNGIYMDAVTGIVVSSNRCSNNGNYGIEVLGTASDLHIGTNFASGNTVGNYAIGATNTTQSGNRNLKSSSTATSTDVAQFNRLSTFGSMLELAKDGTPVGSIGHTGGELQFQALLANTIGLLAPNSSLFFTDDAASNRYFGPSVDNVINLGRAGWRWNTVYAGTGTINTSDKELKQDIAELSDAEKRVGAALKKLIRSYKFKDSVNGKGSEARTHIGVIAQDVQAAFDSEGLDGAAYGVLCIDTLEDGSIRYGVRYDELLCFVIGAS